MNFPVHLRPELELFNHGFSILFFQVKTIFQRCSGMSNFHRLLLHPILIGHKKSYLLFGVI